jgi:ribosomal protein S12 methylthiotransferase
MSGFPGESEEDFRQLQQFIREAEPDWAGFFSYSKEEGTAAAGMDRGKRHVAKKTAEQRMQALQRLQEEISRRRLESYIGSRIDVLVEEQVKGEALFIGRAYFHAPEVDGLVVLRGKGLIPGQTAKARIIRRNGIDLEAAVGEEA